MKQVNTKVNFRQIEKLPELIYDTSFATDPTQLDNLSRLIVTHYGQNMKDWTLAGFSSLYRSYQHMIDAAIKSNNLMGLEALWQGIYFHDRANPDYENDVYESVEHANVKTIQHVLYGYMNYTDLDGKEPLEFSKLKAFATNNPDPNVLRLIESLQCCLDSNNKIHPMHKSILDEDDGDSEMRCLAIKFYECIERFV